MLYLLKFFYSFSLILSLQRSPHASVILGPAILAISTMTFSGIFSFPLLMFEMKLGFIPSMSAVSFIVLILFICWKVSIIWLSFISLVYT